MDRIFAFSITQCALLSVLQSIQDFIQGGHALWKTGKTGKMVKKNSLQGKIREFEILLKIREKSGNFRKSYLCKAKIFKFIAVQMWLQGEVGGHIFYQF